VGKRGADARAAWKAKFEDYKKQFAPLADQLNKMQSGQLPDAGIRICRTSLRSEGMATRESSGKTLNVLARISLADWRIGDLAKSNKTNLTFDGAVSSTQINIAGATSISACGNMRWVQS